MVIDGPGCDDAVDLDGGNVVLARRPARPDEYEPEYGPRDDPEVRA